MDFLTLWTEAKAFIASYISSDDAQEIISGAKRDPELKLKLGLLQMTGNVKEIKKNEAAAVTNFMDAANKGNFGAKYLYGQCLFKGIFTKENKREAIGYYEDAAIKGIPEACYDFAEILFAGEYTDFSPRRASKYYKIAGDYGNIDAQVKYANICMKFQYPMRNYRDAALYFKMAALKGNIDGCYGLGFCLKGGLGLPKNLREAEKWLKKAEEAKHNGATFLLGELYEETEDYDKAVQYYERGISAEFVPAYFNLGMMYERGKGVNKDSAKAKKYIQFAVKQKHPEALFYYGMEIIRKNKDHIGGLRYIKDAADLGFAKAQFEAGKIYNSLNDFTNAATYFKWAADNEVAKAQYSYAYLLKSGNCGLVDDNEVMKYYQKAAENGVPKALFGMGLMYETGSSYYPQDLTKASQLYQQAAEKGVPEAMLKFGQMTLEGRGVKPNEEIGLLYYKKAADSGYAVGQVEYAKILLERGDQAGAFNYHKMAALNNVPESQYYAGSLLMEGKKGVAEKDTKTAAAFLLGAAQLNYEDTEDEF